MVRLLWFQRGNKFDHLSRNTREGSPEPDEGTGQNREERLTQAFMFRHAASVLLKGTLFSGWGHGMSRGSQGWGWLRTSLHCTGVALGSPRANTVMSSTYDSNGHIHSCDSNDAGAISTTPRNPDGPLCSHDCPQSTCWLDHKVGSHRLSPVRSTRDQKLQVQRCHTLVPILNDAGKKDKHCCMNLDKSQR